jgi:mannose-6-phosphate isomerase-like protein (cupin superfamily)
VANAGDVIDGPDGYRMLLLQTGEETGGELLQMDVTYEKEGWMPPPHLHPSQAEHFEVREGSMLTVIEGVERVYEAGESFDVPPGTLHQMTSQGPARIRWEVRPALRTAEFFERVYGDGPGSLQKAESPEAFMAEFAAEIRFQ